MRITKNFQKSNTWAMGQHPAFPHPMDDRHRLAFKICNDNELVPVDTDKEGWTNSSDTLVLGVPDLADAELLKNAPEWLNEYTVDLMRLVALLKPDDLQVQSLKPSAKQKFATVIRMWWD